VNPRFALWPEAASEQAAQVDAISIGLLAISGAIILLVAGLLVLFCTRYRRGSSAPRGALPEFLRRDVELGWTSATLFLAIFIFWWAASTQMQAGTPPPDAMEIHVAAKQWMWKVRHPNGAREINALHVPLGQPVRLVMVSQDVIHSFYVPAFRLKHDVVPGRINQLWFRATKAGTYRLFCAEFCGTDHAAMGGTVTVLSPGEYAAWAAAQPQETDLAEEGAALFTALGCSGCHVGSQAVQAPRLDGVYGRAVPLADGRTVRADAAYIRDSILQPDRDVVAGYRPVMPSFAGLVDDGELQRLLAYIESLREGSRAGAQ